MLGKTVLVAAVVVRDADARKPLRQDRVQHLAATPLAAEKHDVRKGREDPGVAGPLAHFPARFVDVQHGGHGDQLAEGVEVLLPVGGQLVQQGIGLRSR